MKASDLHCHTCGRTGDDAWPSDFDAGDPPIAWMTESECILCYHKACQEHEARYRAAVETLLGRFTDEQFEALKVVLRKP